MKTCKESVLTPLRNTRASNAEETRGGASEEVEAVCPISLESQHIKLPARENPYGASLGPVTDGRDAMYRLFVKSGRISADQFTKCWPSTVTNTPGPVEPFLQRLVQENICPMEEGLDLISQASGAPVLSLCRYAIDCHLVRKYSRKLCFGWCILPFDQMSRTLLVATSNPFNHQASADLRSELGAGTTLRLVWYLAPADELLYWLRNLFF
jgi:hypothetical protein